MGRLGSKSRLLGRLSIPAQLLKGPTLYLCITNGPASCLARAGNRMSLFCLCLCDCSACLPVICVAGHVYRYLFIYVVYTYTLHIRAGNTSSGSLLTRPGDMKPQQPRLSWAVESGTICLPLITLSTGTPLIKHP